MRILIDTPAFVYTPSQLSRETQEDIYALRVLASDLVAADDILTAQIVLTFVDLLEDGATWSHILDDVTVCGRWRQGGTPCVQ